ncbi:sigma factor-like helix-turn-helix DNA-binding protein [Paenibacillus motobuensis]|uniref:sigma factor-like helix-turn-helix DNA-binding protein n=1 Tax=Paenibacillus motobuensis TaxID=295324 RepID=UPI00363C5C1B
MSLCQRIVDADLLEAPAEAVAEELGVSEKQVRRVRLYLAASRPSPIEIGEEGEMNVPTAADDLTKVEVDDFASSLTERQRQVVGLLTNGLTQTEAANELGLSRQAVRSVVLSVRPHYLRYSAA